MKLFEYNRNPKPVKVDYQLEEGKIVIGKKKYSPRMMNLYGNAIEFLALIVIAMSVMGIALYGTKICVIYLLGGIAVFYLGYIYKRITKEARMKLTETQ